MQKDPNPWDIAATVSVMIGSIITSYCIWYYSGRYVGELSLLLPERRVARFSVLDFWGNRKVWAWLGDLKMTGLWNNRLLA